MSKCVRLRRCLTVNIFLLSCCVMLAAHAEAQDAKERRSCRLDSKLLGASNQVRETCLRACSEEQKQRIAGSFKEDARYYSASQPERSVILRDRLKLFREKQNCSWGSETLWSRGMCSSFTSFPESDVVIGAHVPGQKIIYELFTKSVNSDWRGLDTDSQYPDPAWACITNTAPQMKIYKITLDGKTVGEVETYRSLNLKGLPRVTTVAGRIQGKVPLRPMEKIWREWWTHFPILLTARPSFSDPLQWKPVTNAHDLASIRARLSVHFRKDVEVPHSLEFKKRTGDSIWRDYSDEYLKVIKAYRNSMGNIIAAMQFDFARSLQEAATEPMDDIDPPPYFMDQWYFIPQSSALKIKLFGNRLIPLDAGDYDGDGQSEFLFLNGCEYCAGDSMGIGTVSLYDEAFNEKAKAHFKRMDYGGWLNTNGEFAP